MNNADLNDLSAWQIPEIQEATSSATNALNKAPQRSVAVSQEEIEEDLPPLTASDLDEIRQSAFQDGLTQGHAEGYDKGHSEGYEAGFAKGESEGHIQGVEQGKKDGLNRVEIQAELFKSLANTLFHPISKIDDVLEEQLLQLVLQLTRSVLDVEVQTNPKIIVGALQQGIKVLPLNETHYQVSLHPQDLEIIQTHFTAEVIAEQHWQFVPDETVSRGGCDIVTHNNSVDMTIERKMRQVLDRFMLEQGLLHGSDTGE